MFRHLVLTRPLAVIDLETTGLNWQEDRIVEISVLIVYPDKPQSLRTRRLNPEIQIPEAARAVHKISNEDVAHEPPFRMIAADLEKKLDGCDFCGFNFKKFDGKMLEAEFRRANRDWSLEKQTIIDVMDIFHSLKRDLGLAVLYYLGSEHTGAHSAEADALATKEILDAMLEKHGDKLPRTVTELSCVGKKPNAIDSEGVFCLINGIVTLTFGKKHPGKPVGTVAAVDPGYLSWMLTRDNIQDDAKVIAQEALIQARSRKTLPGPT